MYIINKTSFDIIVECVAHRRIQAQTRSGQNDSQSDVPQGCGPFEVNEHLICYNWDVPQHETHQQHA